MNTYPCAELRAKHDYSSITTTLTLQLVHRQLQINIDDSIATIHALTGDWQEVTLAYGTCTCETE